MNSNRLDDPKREISTSRRSLLMGMTAGLITNWRLHPVMSQQLPVSGPAAPPMPLGSGEMHPAANTGAVVDAVNAFLQTLSDEQRRAVLIEFSPENAGRWSNFPAGVVPRNGIFFRDLNPEQLAAALQVARLTLSETGFARMQEIRAADDVYGQSTASRPPGGGPGGRPPGSPNNGAPPGGNIRPGGPGGGGRPGGGGNLFGQGNYIIALLGQPSKTEPWMLQFGGHHLAVNHVYRGAVASSTPYFVGIEPIRWTDANGQVHDPLGPMRNAMQGLLHSLTPEQLNQARLVERFEDVSVGPGRDGQFPATREGIVYTALSRTAQNFVQQAILAWTGDSPQAADYRRRYFAELDQTRIAYSGTGDLKEVADYVRIDGPQVWIELACQPSRTEFPIHFHTVWRDRVTDYANVVRPSPWGNRPGQGAR